MSNISLELREWLMATFEIRAVEISDSQISEDRTIKNAFKLYDGSIVEGVLIPTASRMTACISSQVGCSLTCKFCGTGRLKLMRNLNADEIFDQVVLIHNQSMQNYQIPVTNVVYMGMGEPLLNYKNVLKSVEMLTSHQGLGMAPKRITVSTAGISKMIKKLGDDQVKFHLALSLHAANDLKRNEIMPINEQNTLKSLIEALNYFYDKIGERITLEYIVFKDFNDSIQDAAELVSFCKKVNSKVNIIEYNPIEDGGFLQTTPERLTAFASHLQQNNVIVNIRRSRGKDIDAACGQLANKNGAVKNLVLK
jgi:23S rRNA (adenine2503-C2)-methyltransferase